MKNARPNKSLFFNKLFFNTLNKNNYSTTNKAVAVIFFLLSIVAAAPLCAQTTFPQGSAQGVTGLPSNITIPNVQLSLTEPKTGNEVAFSVRLLILLTILTLAPSILILMTCFLRFSIALDFVKRALSLQQVPPTAVLNGIALFMTLFVMWPTLNEVYEKSFKPMNDGTIALDQALLEAEVPIKHFMLLQIHDRTDPSLRLFVNMAQIKPKGESDLPLHVLVPAYILHELTVAFKIGIILYIPFIVIDMVVASILMSMGMMMLPPVQISMPFKLLLFVLVDGWNILTGQLFTSVVLHMPKI